MQNSDNRNNLSLDSKEVWDNDEPEAPPSEEITPSRKSMVNRLEQLNFSNRFYQLPDDFYRFQLPTPIKNPHLIHINSAMLKHLELSYDELFNDAFRDIVSGNQVLKNSSTIASIYAGHQFGHFVPQLGDGRALYLGEINNSRGEYWELQLKGAGITPFSRQGDGRAVLRSSIREYLCSEAMFGLNIPTTRCLSLVGSEEKVYREQIETGAVVCRMAPSFVRFGSFELFASRGQWEQVDQLSQFVVDNYFPEIEKNEHPKLALFKQVVLRTAELMAKWQAVGFAHGVMNTDNMSILGLTIDYGPFGFLDDYDSQFICNHSDYQGRYRFGYQPKVGRWNLIRLARALFNAREELEQAEQILSLYQSHFQQQYDDLMRQKLGIVENHPHTQTLVEQLLQILDRQKVDYSRFFRLLCDYRLDSQPNQMPHLYSLFQQPEAFEAWTQQYQQILAAENSQDDVRQVAMKAVNPKYILRNYLAQMAIEKAEQEQDFSMIEELMQILSTPYQEHPQFERYAQLPPEWAQEISVSCSS